MKKQHLLTFGCATLLAICSGVCVWAQDPSQVAYTPESASAAARAKNVPASKPHKVWTNDNVPTLRTAADKYLDQKQAEQTEAESNAAAAAKQVKTKESQPPVGGPSALSNPKSPEDAESMIAWEDRDIAAQQEFLDKLRDQRLQAPPEDRDRIQKLIDQRVKIIDQTKKERDTLLTQKKELEKKAAASPKAGTSVTSNLAQ